MKASKRKHLLARTDCCSDVKCSTRANLMGLKRHSIGLQAPCSSVSCLIFQALHAVLTADQRVYHAHQLPESPHESLAVRHVPKSGEACVHLALCSGMQHLHDRL